MVMHRGEVYWCDLNPVRGHEQGKRRPVVVISSDQYNTSRSPMIAVIPLTSAPRKHPLQVPLLEADTGLEKPSTALVDQLRFVDRSRITGPSVGMVAEEQMKHLDRALSLALGLRGQNI
ncbi:MAG: type II toxin-antitoxin system PemK/MazF family toxin [Bryobacteraceae bacterium]